MSDSDTDSNCLKNGKSLLLKRFYTLQEYFPLSNLLTDVNLFYSSILFYDKDLFTECVDFYNDYYGYTNNRLSVENAIAYAKLSNYLTADLWKSLLPMDEKKLEWFYKNNPFYLLGNLYRQMHGIFHNYAEQILSKKFRNMLDFGGGAGGMVIHLARRGMDCSFFDTSDLQSKWVTHISNKLGLGIKVFTSESDIPNDFHFIFANDILEHVLRPQQLIETIKSHCSADGCYFISYTPLNGPDDLHPYHFRISSKSGTFETSVEENIQSFARDLNGFRNLVKPDNSFKK